MRLVISSCALTGYGMDIGVLFDLDGVIVDSHDQHHEAWFIFAKEAGYELTEKQFIDSFGMQNRRCIPEVFKWADASEHEKIAAIGERKEEIYRELLLKTPIEPLPGVRQLLESLAANDIPRCVCSSTSVKNIEVCLASTGTADFFGDKIVGAEDVTKGKPAPDVFLLGAERISRQPEHCVVIEDAHVGVEGALAGGMKVVAVTTIHERDTFGDQPTIIVDS
ncbi:MAG: HAD-IA family hydrolase, partial [Verrucomicrobiota bacterium]